ncbi:MAG: ethanolamine utilization protein EutH [Candidatus Faecivicinus sp.]
MEQAIMWVMAAGALVGGLDRIIGNRFGLGKKFEEGFLLMGSTALSMVGILCLAPMLARLIECAVAPLCRSLGFDPAIFGGILAIDMGGYQLALDLAQDPQVGRYAGVLTAAILGCTVTFTIPVGMGMLGEGDRPDFAKGILFGLIAMPVALILGGTLCGLSLGNALWQSVPMLVLAALLLLGIWKRTNGMIRGFAVFARGIQILTTVGLALGAVTYMTGYALVPGLAPIGEAMEVVAAIGIVMLGSLPVAELLQRALKKPLGWMGARTGMNSASVAGLLIGMVSVLPAIALVKDMDRRGKIVNAAFMVCAASAFAAHLGFVAGVDASMIVPLLSTKLLGGVLGAGIALAATRRNI